MSSNQRSRARHSLASRLALWYSIIFGICTALVFAALYFSLSRIIFYRVDQELMHEFSELAEAQAEADLETLGQALTLETISDGVDKIFFRVLASDGKELAATDSASFGVIPVDGGVLSTLTIPNARHFASLTLDKKHPVRMLYGYLGPGRILQVVLSQKEVYHFLAIFRQIAVLGLILLTAIGALVGWFMTRRALLGVEAVTLAANEITAGALSRRVEVEKRGDEIERLAITFNTMLDRIESLIAGMRELTDNIAHDLRSPIARMRTVAEMSLVLEEEHHEKKEHLAATTIEECDRLLSMINTMLDISEAESGVGQLKIQKIDMVGLILDCCELFEPIAEQKRVAVETDLPASLFVRGDRQKLQRTVANLLDNAMKYSHAGGTVTIAANGEPRQVILTFTDAGIGIAAQHLPHIFERFYRCDKSRSHTGVGLGLSLARAFVRAHGGDITVESELGVGSTFTVTLPAGE